MDLSLQGKQALVCGASQGIGQAIAQELAALGCRVTCLARNRDALAATVESLKGKGHDFLEADHSQLGILTEKVLSLLGGRGSYHILVNNSSGPAGGPIVSAQDQEFLDALNAHLMVNINLTRLLLPGMREAQYGRIINVISTSVKIPLQGLGVSNTTRGAVANWAKTLSYEVAGDGITVNNVLPGATETDRLKQIVKARASREQRSASEVETAMKSQIPAGRFGQVQEIAAMAAFLASPAASYVNGASIPVDGGRTGSL